MTIKDQHKTEFLTWVSEAGDPTFAAAASQALLMVESSWPTSKTTELQPRIDFSLRLARVVLDDLGLGLTSMTAALLYGAYKQGVVQDEQVLRACGPETVTILTGLKKMHLLNTSRTRIHSEHFIELLLSMSEDVRVVLIKTAERHLKVRMIDELIPEDQLNLAHEAADLYAPIAHRLGLYLIKSEFEETSMRVLLPDKYREISQKLAETRHNREKYIQSFIHPLKDELKRRGFTCEVKGRPKSIHSIWNKMSTQGVDFDEVYDLFAIRIILDQPHGNEKSDCWQVYSIVTDKYQPNPNRLRDWISSPKPNGYESLHTTVIGPEGRWVEVQIRTRRMDVIAEKGHASHWRYKENAGSKTGDEWLNQIRTALEGGVERSSEPAETAKNELYSDQIYIFTPDGDLLKLKRGSTVLDFAFGVHTQVGFHCTGARVNGHIVPIRHKLVNGDQVEILTSTQQRPKNDWLNIVVTSKARSRIKRVLKEAEYSRADEGKEILKRKFEQWRARYDVTTIHRLVNWLGLKTSLDLYQQVAENKVDLAQVREWLRVKNPAEYIREKTIVSKSVEEFKKTVIRQEDYLLIDDDMENVDYKMARCCNPIFGDEVFGFVTVKEGTKIHRINCPNARQLIQRYPYRIVKVRWTNQQGGDAAFNVNVQISGLDDIGIVNEISRVISSDLRVNMRGMHMNSKDGLFNGVITLMVNDRNHLDVIMQRIRRVKGVLSVKRTDEMI